MTPPPRIVFVHYHLRRGGVTRVMEQAARALAPHGTRIAALVGEPPPEHAALPFPVAVLPELAYGAPAGEPAALAAAAARAARALLGGEPDLWHVHNHPLGKNLGLPLLARRLAEEGRALLLQVHDFPEDGRPDLYRRLADGLGARLADTLYPEAPHVHYALLNGRDRGLLRAAGLPGDRAHALPNAVALDAPAPSEPPPRLPGFPEGPLALYPTRAIRRKNLGELLLRAAVHHADGAWYGVTLAPENPAARPGYERWKERAAAWKLPVRFELGLDARRSLADLFRAARYAVTTSVAEGFGLAFLEPWLAGRALEGRDLPEITADFAAEGVDLSSLYPTLPVPEDWIDANRLRRRIDAALRASRAAYGLPCGGADLDAALNAARCDGGFDFGRLDEPLQEEVLARLVRGEEPPAGLARRLRPTPLDEDALARRADAIRQNFGAEAYGRRLLALYQRVAAAPAGPVGALDADALRRAFTAPERFYLLRT